MIRIKTALISVYDKTGVLELAQRLKEKKIEIISSGGTSKYLKQNNIEVTEISEYTGFSEAFNGRVKTLHPKIHAGILARGNKDEKELKNLGAKKIDLVVVNLYPFSEEVAKGSSDHDIIEKIDIGGPAMIRAAAKNFEHTVVIAEPDRYLDINLDGISAEESKKLAGRAFTLTGYYDESVSDWFGPQEEYDSERIDLRYGENPHQIASIEISKNTLIDFKSPLQGKQISYNNGLDAISAWSCVNEFNRPAVCIVKHTNPCGVAEDSNLSSAYKRAFSTDPTSAFGGVIALNDMVDEDLAKEMMDNQFIEVLVAPNYSDGALKALSNKPNIRALMGKKGVKSPNESKSISGVFFHQTSDEVSFSEMKYDTKTKVVPSNKELEDLIFAMKVAKHVKSNAIIIAKDKMTLGIGAGQMSRVVSTKIAFMKAEEEGLNIKNCVLASDAFFPFRDNIDVAAAKGVKHIIQPGGSIKDDEVIAAADEYQISMTLTGFRHFKH